jgi:hypothetical protein
MQKASRPKTDIFLMPRSSIIITSLISRFGSCGPRVSVPIAVVVTVGSMSLPFTCFLRQYQIRGWLDGGTCATGSTASKGTDTDDPKDRSLAPASALNTLGADLKIGRATP